MTDSDSELGDFNPQNDSEEQTEETETDADVPHPPQQGEERELVGSRTPGRGVPELRNSRSEHDRQIRPGDVVRDLWGNGWLIAYRKKADSVKEYDQMQDDTKPSLLSYEGSIGVGATEEDEVWCCFYVNANNTLAGGRSGPYDFPESRIVRYAYEATDGFKKGRFQDHIQMQVLEELATAAIQHESDAAVNCLETLMKNTFGVGETQEAFEVAEATVGDHDG